MKYQGYEITKQYNPGSDFKIYKNGVVKSRIPKKEDIDYYYAEQITTGFKSANCSTITEMKKHIDNLNICEEYVRKHYGIPKTERGCNTGEFESVPSESGRSDSGSES